MKVLVVFTFIILSALTSYARTITGIVYSDSTMTAVADAVCKLYEEDVQISNTTTNENGLFQIRTENKSALILEIDKEGFSGTVIIIDAGGKDIDLGSIALSEASTLDELKVESTNIVHSKGRTIVFPSQADLDASATTLSLFQKLPLAGLLADPVTRTLSVNRGKPVILINGIPASMDDVNALQPKDIEKIEYSYITPARYADKGCSGFLSITLKEREDGGQVYLWGRSAVNTAFVDGFLRASYHQGPSQFTLQYNPSWRNYQHVYDYTSEKLIGDDYQVDIESHDRNPFNYQTHSVALKYDFAPSDRTVFSARFTATPMDNNERTIGSLKDTELGEYELKSKSSSRQFSPSLDLFVRHNFNEKNSLEAQVVGTITSDNYRHYNHYDIPGNNNFVNDVNNRRRSLISEISYVHGFDQTMSLSGGIQNSMSHNTNEYIGKDFKPVLTDNNNYIYARFSKQFSRVYLTAATGMKLFWTRNDDIRRNFIRNLSSLNASWYIGQKWVVQGSFSYTPVIPSLAQLTEYEVETTPYLSKSGNPNLKVGEHFSYVLSGQYTHRKFSASIMTGVYDFKNAPFYDVVYKGNGKFLSQILNADKCFTWQSALQLRISEIYGFGANVALILSRYESAINDWNYHLTSFSGTMNLWWHKGPWIVSYYRKFPGKDLFSYNVSREENSDILQVEFRPDKHWTLGIGWWYMFEKKGTKYPSWSYSHVNPSYTQRYIENNGNMVVLSACYTADFGALFKRNTNRSLNNTDSNNSLLKN